MALVGPPTGGPGHPVSFGTAPTPSSAAPIVGGNGGNVGMNPPAVVDLAGALSQASPELQAIADMISGAERASLLTSGVTGAIDGLADMTAGAGAHLVGAADDLAGFRLPNMPTGIGGVTGSLTTPGQGHPLTGAATATTNQTGDAAVPIGIAPALPVTSPNSKQTKGAGSTPIGATSTPTTTNTTAAAPKGGSPIGSPPVVPAAALAPVAVPQAKGATSTPITTSPNPATQGAMGIGPSPAAPTGGVGAVAIPAAKGATIPIGTTNLNPAAQAAMGIAPSPAHGPAADLPKGATGTPIGSIPGPIEMDSDNPYAGEFDGINELIIERNQTRFDSLLAQGFSEADALSFIIAKGSPSDAAFGSPKNIAAMTAGELNYFVSTWEESGKSGNDPILDAMVRELNQRTDMAGAGPYFSNANVDSLVISESMGADYAAVDEALRINEINELNESLQAMPGHLRADMENRLDTLVEAYVGDADQAELITAALGSGATDLGGAMQLVLTMELMGEDPSRLDVGLLQNQVNGLADDGFGVGEAALAAMIANQSGVDAAAIKRQMELSGNADPFAAAMQVQADQLGVTVPQLEALIVASNDKPVFDTAHQIHVEGKSGDLIDEFVSLKDYQAVVDNPDQFSPEQVSAAQVLIDMAAGDAEFAASLTQTSLWDSFSSNFLAGESQVGGLINLAQGRVTPGAIEFGANFVKDGGYGDTIVAGADQIMTIVPGSPQFIELALTDPGQLADNYVEFGKGVGDFAVDIGKLAAALTIASNPVLTAAYYEQTGTHMPTLINETLLNAGKTMITDPDAMASAMIGWDTFEENPLRWAGQMAPEVVIEVATAGSFGAGVKGANAAMDIADAVEDVQDVAAAANRADDLLPDYQGLSQLDPAQIPTLYHYTDQKYVDAILENGLWPGTFATPDGSLSGLGAVIDNALPPNRPHPNAVIEIDAQGLVDAGFEIPDPSRVSSTVTDGNGQVFQMPGGGFETKIPDAVPPGFLSQVQMGPGGPSDLGGIDLPPTPGGPALGGGSPDLPPGTTPIFSSGPDAVGGLPTVSLDDAAAIAAEHGIDMRGIELRYEAGADPHLYGMTSMDGAGNILRADDGRYIVTLTDAGLSSPGAALNTIAHELNHIREISRTPGFHIPEEAAATLAGDLAELHMRGD